MRRLSMSAPCVLFAAAVSACGARPDSAPSAGRVDSAGVVTVTNDAPRLGASAWRVESVPVIVIGDDSSSGTPATLFQRVTGATRTRDGGIAVVDVAAQELRYFDANGNFVRSAGRKGEGPGEFEGVQGLLRVPDGYLVTDWTGRNAVYDDNGRLVRSVRIPGTAPIAAFANGAFVAEGGFSEGGEIEFAVAGSAGGFGAPKITKISVDSVVITSYERDGARRDTIGRFPYAFSAGDFVPFTPRGLYLASGSRFYSAFGNRAELTTRDESNRVTMITRWFIAGTPITQQHKGERRRLFLIDSRGAPYQGEELKERVARADAWLFPDSLPRIHELLSDSEGNLWVRRYQVADGLPHRIVTVPRVPDQWDVFDGGGEWLTTVVTPANVRVMDVGRDYLIGVAADDDGVESVRLYTLRRK